MPRLRRRFLTALAPLVIAGALTVPGAGPASADPGHCWRAGAGPIANTPAGFLYEIKNRCASSIKIKIVFADGRRGQCLRIDPYGFRWYSDRQVYSYWSGVNC